MNKWISELEAGDYAVSGNTLYQVTRVTKGQMNIVEIDIETLQPRKMGPVVATRAHGKVMGTHSTYISPLHSDVKEWVAGVLQERTAKQAAREARAAEWEAKLQAVRTANPLLQGEQFFEHLEAVNFVDSKQRACKMLHSMKACKVPARDYSKMLDGVRVQDVTIYCRSRYSDEITSHGVSSVEALTLYEALVQLIAEYAWD